MLLIFFFFAFPLLVCASPVFFFPLFFFSFSLFACLVDLPQRFFAGVKGDHRFCSVLLLDLCLCVCM